ncbi:hypothetical protein ETD86_14700 [Nonomuraea turkmeniaca]|uniref:Uncharacterized protein n=1 Tax=Nonomuraea turkmeniaca TaxID=103838 RepID=A0A5S4FLM5_9ACTN|nr:hypothetical protein [Nonomuraea turkmeniaca]TMR21553.1 hypothetical protein ETD86_14700 [Nonomuraea turkmeniaca]
MIRQGLILAGLVGGLLASGGSAFAATSAMQMTATDDDNRKIVFVCGDDAVLAHGDVDQKTVKVVDLDLHNGLIAGVLGTTSSDDNRKCEFN